MPDVPFKATRGHTCRVLRRWVAAGESYPLEAGEADRRVRHGLGVIEESRAVLSDMTVPQLRAFAASAEVDLPPRARKDEIIAILTGDPPAPEDAEDAGEADDGDEAEEDAADAEADAE